MGRRILTCDQCEDCDCECHHQHEPIRRRNSFFEFFKAEPFWAFLICGSICAAIVEVVALIVLHHPIDVSNF